MLENVTGSEAPKIEFLRISRLSGQHLSVPRKFLRDCGLTGKPGNKDEYFAIFRIGQVLMAVPLQKEESVADAGRKIRESLGNYDRGR